MANDRKIGGTRNCIFGAPQRPVGVLTRIIFIVRRDIERGGA